LNSETTDSQQPSTIDHQTNTPSEIEDKKYYKQPNERNNENIEKRKE